MSNLEPTDPTPAPEPAAPATPTEPNPTAAPQAESSGPEPSFWAPPADATVPAPEPVRTAPRDWADGGAASGAASERRRQNGIALYATVALIVVLAFGSGIVVGRATVGEGGTAAASPAPSASSAVSPAPGGSIAPGSSDAASGAPASPAASDPLAGLPNDGPLLGSKTAKVQLTYWADFQCPYCAQFAQDILPKLASRIADGTVSVLHRDFIFIGPESLRASVAVRCAGEQGLYWPMHDAVYAAQNGENEGAFSDARLKQLAAGVGVDAAKFSACTERHDVVVGALDDTSAGVRASVKSTPTIDLPGKRLLGITDVDEFLAAIDAAAADGAQPTPAPSVAPSGDPWGDTKTKGRTAGPSAAPVTVELWVDYQATGMPDIVGKLEPELRKRIAAGKVQVVLRDLATLGDESILAASFMRCGADAGESTVWFAHDIFASAAQGAGKGIFTTDAVLSLAAKLGWNVVALDACLADPATAAAVKAETAVGTGQGLNAAPAVVVKAGGAETARFSGSSLDVDKVMAAVDKAAK